MRIHCGEDYPDRCPVVRFVSKLNMGCVDQRSGEVFRNKLAVLAQWNRNYGIEQVRCAVRCGEFNWIGWNVVESDGIGWDGMEFDEMGGNWMEWNGSTDAVN